MNEIYSREIPGMCSHCEKSFMNLVENGFCYMDLDNNGICINCYDLLQKNGKSKKFRMEWTDRSRPIDFDIYE